MVPPSLAVLLLFYFFCFLSMRHCCLLLTHSSLSLCYFFWYYCHWKGQSDGVEEGGLRGHEPDGWDQIFYAFAAALFPRDHLAFSSFFPFFAQVTCVTFFSF